MTQRNSDMIPSRAAGQQGCGRPERPRAEQLDPEANALLKLLNLAVRKPIDGPSLRRHRLSWRISASALARAEAVARVETHHIPGPESGIELRLYRPALQAEPAPAFLWFHGGAFLMGGIATADTICRHLALASGAVVIAVRYRLAPEHDLYAGREDCLAAMEWIAREGGSLGIDTARLAVGGDSAGGNLAAAVAQRCAERGGPALRLQVLVYPATNLRDDFESKRENASGYMLTAEGIDAIEALLDQGKPDVADPWISPALKTQLRGLPPALILTAGFDPIRDDGLAYTGLLRKAGVPVELLHYAGQFHGFLNFDGVLRAARDALDRVGSSLRQALAPLEDAPRALVDRTLELAARSRAPLASPVLRAGGSMLVASLMLGERLEGWRKTLTRSLLPDHAWTHALTTSALFNPVTSYRARLAERYAAIEARETYRRSAGETACAG
jgi:acetyl esterase